jgi:outer membrane protein
MNKYHYAIILIAVYLGASAQNDPAVLKLTLKEAVDYAVKNSNTVKNAKLDQKISDAKTRQAGMQGVPQVTVNVDFLHYFHIQNTILENNPGTTFYRPQSANPANPPDGAPLRVGLALPNQLLPTLNATQVIFDQSFFTALRSSKMFQELSILDINRNEIDVALAVTKAYYSVLVNEKQLLFIDINLKRLDSAYREANARYEAGLARKIEVDRTEVTFNNLKEERLNVIRTTLLSKMLLKFQMNLSHNVDLITTDTLNENLLVEAMQLPDDKIADYSNRIEYSIQQKQTYLNQIDVKNAQSGYYPKLLAIGLLGANPAATDASNIFKFDNVNINRWVPYGYLGLRLQIPITAAFTSIYTVQQKKYEGEKLLNNKLQLERRIDNEVDQSILTLKNTLDGLKIQRRNIELAGKNLAVSREEYKQGIAIALEVTTAESALKEAQTNYYKALYNALVSKAEYDKAMGNLYK